MSTEDTKASDSKTKISQNPPMTTKTSEMDKLFQTILKTSIKAIPLLTIDNYTLWKNQVENMLDLQELTDALTKPDGKLSSSQDFQL
jgi:hypothetical protein